MEAGRWVKAVGPGSMMFPDIKEVTKIAVTPEPDLFLQLLFRY